MSAEIAAREDEWVRLFANRDDLAEEYAAMIRHSGPAWDGWGEVNAAILRRWSPSGLNYIKTRAWKIVGSGSHARLTDRPSVQPDGICEDCGERACPECGREKCGECDAA